MALQDNYLLSLLIWLPISGGALLLLIGKLDQSHQTIRRLTLLISLITGGLSLLLLHQFDPDIAMMQFQENTIWIKSFNINYALGIDGISLLLILLTTFLTVLVVLSAWRVIEKKVAEFMASILILEGFMIGVFAALDAVIFYLFWEAMLIPMFLLIGIWGGTNRIYAAIKFFLYTLLGSLLMLVALLYLYNQSGGSFAIRDYYHLPLAITPQILIFLAFFAAFAVKIPMFPVHTWLPDAHVEAPTAGSVILAAVMLKMGGYGFIRFSLPITPDASQELAWFILLLSLIAVVYISLIALVQKDMKKLIAYSSISHMGFVTIGLFIFNNQGVDGAVIQMISHGFISAALFLCVGVLYDRLHSREVKTYMGIATPMPRFATLFTIFAMANVGLPGTSGFVGEFLVILGAFKVNPWVAVIAALTLIFGAAYTLWLIKRVVFGAVTDEAVAKLQDISYRESGILILLALCVIAVGVWPDPLLHLIRQSTEMLLLQVAESKL